MLIKKYFISFILSLFAPLLFSASLAAQEMPKPPCAQIPLEYGEIGVEPIIRIWTGNKDINDWSPPSCVGWLPMKLLVAVETAGRFYHDGPIEEILSRFGKISNFRTIFYWSHTRTEWRTLIPEAQALSSSNMEDTRDDFSPEELTFGSKIFFWQKENTPAGNVVYEMTIIFSSPDRITLSTKNANTIKNRRLKLLNPGEYQFYYFIERENESIWRYYSLMRSAAPSNPLINLVWPMLND